MAEKLLQRRDSQVRSLEFMDEKEVPNANVPESEPAYLANGPPPQATSGPGVFRDRADTRFGTDAEKQGHIFEPFFPTKGTGAGNSGFLATVLGTVEQRGGVHCRSPLCEADKDARPAGFLAGAPRGSEVILLVEDEDAIRKFSRRILETIGYVVLDARNGREGLSLCEAHRGPIDLLLTDVMMPELGGAKLAELAVKLRPGMRVMFMSGYTKEVVLKGAFREGAAFLQKPFPPAALAHKVRETLDSRVGCPAQT